MIANMRKKMNVIVIAFPITNIDMIKLSNAIFKPSFVATFFNGIEILRILVSFKTLALCPIMI